MKNNPLPRLDEDSELRNRLLKFCRLKPGEIWDDPMGFHRVGCLDAANKEQIDCLVANERPTLAVHDPPYNLVAFETRSAASFVEWCQQWTKISLDCLADDSSYYVWLGADQNKHYQPLPQFMMMMESMKAAKSRAFITMRNQRGYGTQKNWMAVRQELLFYTKGNPGFDVQYTGIPKILRGYYKDVAGERTENLGRGKSENIRASNVWVDIQQVFYRMQENVSGCYAQKPLAAIERIVQASSQEGDGVLDLFAHSGTTMIACERTNRKCLTADIDPIYCEMSIRRLEHYRETGQMGWQNHHAFATELGDSPELSVEDTVLSKPANAQPQASLF